MIKKGELTTQQIVMLIVLLVSFSIILFLIFRLNLGDVTDQEICHNSVVLASKGSGLVGNLDCRTSYVCISGGDDCDDFNPTVIREVKLTGDKNKDETAIMNEIAEEMAECWWMFGEGEIDYVGGDFDGNHCAICSVVKFDDKIQTQSNIVLIYDDLFNYLDQTQKDSSQTYLTYLYGASDQASMKKWDYPSTINLGGKYVVITGLNNNFKFLGVGLNDDVVYPSFVESGTKLLTDNCQHFDITKA